MSDIPRRLNEKEINYILSDLPYPVSFDNDTNEILRNQMIDYLGNKIKNNKLKPSKINKLKDTIKKYFLSSLLIPGDSQGILSATSFGNVATQETLNTFHHSGRESSQSSTIEKMKNIIFINKEQKSVSSTIYFKNKLITYEDIIFYFREKFIQTSVYSLIENYWIKRSDQLEKYWWHDYYEEMNNIKLPKVEIMRIKFSKVEMYKRKVSLQFIISKLLEDEENPFIFVPSSMNETYIDLYPNIEMVKSILNTSIKDEKNKSNRSKTQSTISHDSEYNKDTDISSISKDVILSSYYQDIVLKDFKTKIIKGIKRIESIFPVTVKIVDQVIKANTIKLIKSDDHFPKELEEIIEKYKNKIWCVQLDRQQVNLTGVDYNNFQLLFGEINVKVIYFDDNEYKLYLKMNEYYFSLINDKKVNVLKKLDKFYIERDLNDRLVINDTNYIRINKPKIDNNTIKESSGDSVYITYSIADVIIGDDKEYYRFVDLKESKNKVYELIDPLNYKIEKYNPIILLDDEILNAENRLKEKKRVKKEEIIKNKNRDNLLDIVYVEKENILKYSEYLYIQTIGSNLKKVLKFPFVDKKRTTSNNIFEIKKLFGIENARTFIVQELSILFKGKISPSHILFIADFITNKGEINGITASKQPGGHLSKASTESAGEVIVKNAIFGREEDIKNVSASVIVGERMSNGNGYFLPIEDPIEYNEEKILDVIDTNVEFDLESEFDPFEDETMKMDIPFIKEEKELKEYKVLNITEALEFNYNELIIKKYDTKITNSLLEFLKVNKSKDVKKSKDQKVVIPEIDNINDVPVLVSIDNTLPSLDNIDLSSSNKLFEDSYIDIEEVEKNNY